MVACIGALVLKARGAKDLEARGEGAHVMDVMRTLKLKYFQINPYAQF